MITLDINDTLNLQEIPSQLQELNLRVVTSAELDASTKGILSYYPTVKPVFVVAAIEQAEITRHLTTIASCLPADGDVLWEHSFLVALYTDGRVKMTLYPDDLV